MRPTTLQCGSEDLLRHLQQGATLVSYWKSRHSQFDKPKRLHLLTLTDGQLFYVQRSAVERLIKIKAIERVFKPIDCYDYRVIT